MANPSGSSTGLWDKENGNLQDPAGRSSPNPSPGATHILVLARMDQLHESLDNPGFIQPLQGKEQDRKSSLDIGNLEQEELWETLQEGEALLSLS